MADELVQLTDGTNTVNFLALESATTGYLKRNIEGLDPPPCEIRYAGGRPVSREWQNREVTITFGVVASDASDLTTKKTTIITILENTYLYWVSNGKRGAKATLQYRRPGGTNISYADVYSGECDWGTIEHQRGAPYAYVLEGAQLHLTCETGFHPSAVVSLGQNYLRFPHFEEWSNGTSDAQPDGWDDWESLTAGTGTNNRESTNIAQGTYSLKTIASGINNNDYKGVYQNILSEVVTGTTYTLIVFVKNDAITNGLLEVYALGDVSGSVYAVQEATAHSSFTKHSVSVTPNASDAYFYIIARIKATSNGCEGTVYIDKMMVKEGSSAPDEWSSYYKPHNAKDATNERVNYIDASGILGSLDAPCNIKLEPVSEFTGADIDKFWVAMVGPMANIKYWGEIDMSYDANRSNESRYMGLATASYSGWSGPPTSLNYIVSLNATEWAAMAGRTWRVLGGMKAGATTVDWRGWAGLRGPSEGDRIVVWTGKGVAHPEANQWCIVDLGPLYLTQPMAGDYSGDTLYIAWQYSNPGGAATIIEVDFLCFIPEHDYSLLVDKHASSLWNYIYRATTDKLYIKEAVDFSHHVFTESYTGPENIGCLGSSEQGTYPRLKPGVDNRIIFLFAEDGDRHNVTRQFKATISYLPQHLVPLE